MILNTDSVPSVIFHVVNSCFEESFGDKWNEREGRYFHTSRINIQIRDREIFVSDKKTDEEMETECVLTEVKPGKYAYRDGRVKWLGK